MSSKITNKDLILADKEIQRKRVGYAQKNLLAFTRYTMPNFDSTPFHKVYYKVLGMFARGEIKRLMITVPPQHGKSEGSTRRMPAFILGQNPNTKIAVASYNATFARKFNRDVQRIIDSKEYHAAFPGTTLNNSNVVTVSSSHLRNSDEFEVVDNKGGLKAVGRGGPLTGNQVDVMVMDDLYKDFLEGNSPIIRESVWDWYTSVVRTRMHNDSQEIIVFTRWHEDDLIGRIEKKEEVITVKSWDDIKNANPKSWIKINFEALKTGEPTEIDPRAEGEALYPQKHNAEKLSDDRVNDPVKFDALYKGNPTSKDGLLYGEFKEYKVLPDNIIIRKNYTDTADTGDDWLYSIDYDVSSDGYAYVIDIRCSQEAMEVTEPLTAGGLLKNNVNEADVESNNGGRGFARKIDEMTGNRCVINWFHQGSNKESLIISQSASVMQRIIMPDKWHLKFPEAYQHITSFKRKFKANIHDDAADVLTGIVERMDFVNNGSMIYDLNDL